jgi:hypothetical protein
MSTFEPADRSITTWDARVAFLQTVRKVAPEVLKDLQGEPFEIYRSARLLKCRELDKRPDVRCWKVFESDPRLCSPPILALRASLLRWGDKYKLRWKDNLIDQWCLEQAFKTIEHWYDSPLYRDLMEWRYMGVGFVVPINDAEGQFDFTFKKWDTTDKSRSAYKAAAIKAFKDYLNNYCDRIEAATRERGYVERARKRDASHFIWLVWYQVKGKSHAWISSQFNASRQTIAEGIKEAARLCGLPLRSPQRPGRPKKSQIEPLP